MPSKEIYIRRLQEIYLRKNGEMLSDVSAAEYLEKLLCLVNTIIGDIQPQDIIIAPHGQRR